MISRPRHERRAWTGSDGYAVDSSRLRDYARRGGGWVADAPMRRYKAGRRAVCCGGWAGAQPLLRPRPRPFAGAQAQRLARRQEQGPGRTWGAEEADKGPRGRAPGSAGGGLEGEEGRMRKNGLRRHYDRLTPEERFRLDVSAMARGDAAESGR